MRLALGVEFQRAQRDLALGALERVFERDLDGRVMVFAARADSSAASAPRALGRAEQRREELAEFGMVGRAAAGAAVELEARVPVRAAAGSRPRASRRAPRWSASAS